VTNRKDPHIDRPSIADSRDRWRVDQNELRRAIAQFLRSNRLCACGQPATRVILPTTREPQLLMNRRTWRAVCFACAEKPGSPPVAKRSAPTSPRNIPEFVSGQS
jgi:hypothetical protein